MTCKDCIHSGLCYKENDYDNFPDKCGSFIPERTIGDLISREALRKTIKKLNSVYMENKDHFYTEVLFAIDNAQAVLVNNSQELVKDLVKENNERPHGEWVSKHLWDNTHAWVCSECGNRNTHGITVEKACWRCGADMRGNKE